MMTDDEIDLARADIEATADLLARAMKLSGLVTTLFQERVFSLVVVGGGAVEFYTEGGYMSGGIDFCRKTLKSVPPRLMQEIAERLGGKGLGRIGSFADSMSICWGFRKARRRFPSASSRHPMVTCVSCRPSWHWSSGFSLPSRMQSASFPCAR